MHKANPSPIKAVEIIRRGGVVAIPTETFYGLAADATNPLAIARIFEIKGRPSTMALPLVGASLEQVEEMLGALDPRTAAIARLFWPAPLSLIVGAPPRFREAAGQEEGPGAGRTVAVRVPDHVFVRELAARAGTLLTATSANRTGEAAVTDAAAVERAIGSLVDLVVDGGTTPGGLPSTIADLRGPAPRLIRAGAIAWPRILEALPVAE